jgi:hypothetical protein
MNEKGQIHSLVITRFILAGFISGMFTACKKHTDKPNILWITIEDTSPHFILFKINGNQLFLDNYMEWTDSSHFASNKIMPIVC